MINVDNPFETRLPLEQYRANVERSRDRDSLLERDRDVPRIKDEVSFSLEAINRSRSQDISAPSSPGAGNLQLNELSNDDEKVLAKLRLRDAEVRQHEAAHVAAGGAYVRGGPKYQYTRGPDGQLYATSGGVSIDVSKESTPEATLRKASVVRRAALAPANPSGPDRQVAAQATRLETQARQEIAETRRAEASGDEEPESRFDNAITPLEPREVFPPQDGGASFAEASYSGIDIRV